MQSSKKGSGLRLGVLVLIILAVLTAVEYWVALSIHSNPTLILAVIALVKAGFVVQYFMHLPRVFSKEGGHA